MKRPEGTGTARNDESPPCRNRYVGDCACEHLIWDHGKRLSWCLAGGPQRKRGLFHAVRIADARQGLAASLVIFWAFLGIRASAAGRTTGRLAPLVKLAHILSPKETRMESANIGTGRVIGLRRFAA